MIEPSNNLQNIFDDAVSNAKALQHEYITIEHLIYAIMCDQQSFEIIEKYGADAKFIKTNLDHYLKNNLNDIKIDDDDHKPKKTTSVERVLNRCFTQVLFSGRQKMEVADIIISVLSEKNSFGFYFLSKGGLTKEKFIKYFQENIEVEEGDEQQPSQGTNSTQMERVINTFCTNLSLAAKQRKIDPVIGRDDELEKI